MSASRHDAPPCRRGGLIDRVDAARLQLRRQALCRPSGRHAGLGAARQRRPAGRPLVQVSPAARRPDAPASDEPNALVELRTRRAARAEHARDDDRALRRARRRAARTAGRRSTSTSWRSTSWLSPIFVAGFYYKTFMGPADAAGRRSTSRSSAAPPASAGPATASRSRPLREAPERICDVLVVGAGPAGLAAALAAGRAGARVILCEEDVALGGRLLVGRRHDRRHAGGRLGRAGARRTRRPCRMCAS